MIEKHSTITSVKRIGPQPPSNISLTQFDSMHNSVKYQSEMKDAQSKHILKRNL